MKQLLEEQLLNGGTSQECIEETSSNDLMVHGYLLNEEITAHFTIESSRITCDWSVAIPLNEDNHYRNRDVIVDAFSLLLEINTRSETVLFCDRDQIGIAGHFVREGTNASETASTFLSDVRFFTGITRYLMLYGSGNSLPGVIQSLYTEVVVRQQSTVNIMQTLLRKIVESVMNEPLVMSEEGVTHNEHRN